jgi:hypothetical protein
MLSNEQQRIAQLKSRVGTVRIIRKARANSRVVPFDVEIGKDSGDTYLVATDQLINIRSLAEDGADVSRTIRLKGRIFRELESRARPFETPAEVIERLLRDTIP